MCAISQCIYCDLLDYSFHCVLLVTWVEQTNRDCLNIHILHNTWDSVWIYNSQGCVLNTWRRQHLVMRCSASVMRKLEGGDVGTFMVLNFFANLYLRRTSSWWQPHWMNGQWCPHHSTINYLATISTCPKTCNLEIGMRLFFKIHRHNHQTSKLIL